MCLSKENPLQEKKLGLSVGLADGLAEGECVTGRFRL